MLSSRMTQLRLDRSGSLRECKSYTPAVSSRPLSGPQFSFQLLAIAAARGLKLGHILVESEQVGHAEKSGEDSELPERIGSAGDGSTKRAPSTLSK